jgi:hypothetical protein
LRDALAVFSGEEVVAPELLVGDPVLEDVVGADKDRVSHGDDRLLVAPAATYAQVLSAQVCVFGAPGRGSWTPRASCVEYPGPLLSAAKRAYSEPGTGLSQRTVGVAQTPAPSEQIKTIQRMTMNFLACDRERAFPTPPDPRDWLPEGHLVWFLLASRSSNI